MSTRNVRKLFNVVTLPPLEGNSDEEFEPNYVKKSATAAFQGLVLSSSDSDANDPEDVESNETELVVTKKKKNNKKNARKKKKSVPSIAENELDEIDKYVSEVNALLGAPPPAIEAKTKPTDTVSALLSVQYKYLCYEEELQRKMGPGVTEDGTTTKKLDRESQLRVVNRCILIPSRYKFARNTPNKGLSMSVQRRDDDATYYTFDHSQQYQRRHKEILNGLRTGHLYAHYELHDKIHYAVVNMHVELILECIDKLFLMEEYTYACELLEQMIVFMQYNSHLSFNVTFKKTRLEYKYIENRPFHVAILKFMHVISNMAFHRTALELAKMLLNLDPSDPLAVLFVIDTIALRAREHKWLIDIVDEYFEPKRDAKFMFNIQYSYAMAHFHVARKAKADLAHADSLMQTAIMRFPLVVLKLIDNANMKPSSRIQGHPVFQRAPKETSKDQTDIISLYAALAVPRWKERLVWDWFMKNVDKVMDRYDSDKEVQASVDKFFIEQANLFRSWPDEIIRHVLVITPMSNLLVEGAVPALRRTPSANLATPDPGINRYGYDFRVRDYEHSSSIFYDLFSSLIPRYNLEPPPGHRPPRQE